MTLTNRLPLEDSFKFLGIVCWLVYLVHTSATSVIQARGAPARAPS